ncbi:unnamed protein product, partial [Symbiodinium microadriaticum]
EPAPASDTFGLATPSSPSAGKARKASSPAPGGPQFAGGIDVEAIGNFFRQASAEADAKGYASAHCFRAAVAARASRAGGKDIAARLQSGEWPSEAGLHFFAAELGGSLLITSIFAEEKVLFGHGPIRVHVLHGLTEPDPDGHSSGHFELLQS